MTDPIRWSKQRDRDGDVLDHVGVSDCGKYTLVRIEWDGATHFEAFFGQQFLIRTMDRDVAEAEANRHRGVGQEVAA